MSQIFLKLGFVSAIAQEREQLLLADIWRHVGGDEDGKGSIPITNCKNFMRAIQNFHHQDIIDNESESNRVDPNNLGKEYESGLMFKPSEIDYISRTYRFLYANRQDKLAEDKKCSHMMRSIQKQKFGESYQFKPTTTRNTQRIAEQIRMSQRYPDRVEDRLMYNEMQREQDLEALRLQEEMKMKQQTPFHPISRSPTHKPRRYTELEGQYQDKWEYLHNDAYHKSKTFKRDIDKEEADILKEQDQYTFQPNKNGKVKSPRKGE